VTDWIWLLLAILFEVAGTISMKFSDGFNNIYPSVMAFIFYGLCIVFLIFALRTIDIGIAYAIWSGMGTIMIITAGTLLFKEPATLIKMAAITLIIIGVAILHLSDKIG